MMNLGASSACQSLPELWQLGCIPSLVTQDKYTADIQTHNQTKTRSDIDRASNTETERASERMRERERKKEREREREQGGYKPII